MMTECTNGHEWGPPFDNGYYGCLRCPCVLSPEQVTATLNAHVELKRGGYGELVMAVVNKHEGESRHETALRYIQERENQEGRVATSNALKEPISREHVAGVLCAMQIAGDDEASKVIEQFIVQLETEHTEWEERFAVLANERSRSKRD